MTALRFQLGEVIEAGKALETTATFSVWLDETPIWPVRGDGEATIEIQIDDLLAQLTETWKPLLLQQTYPLALTPLRPRDLRAEAARHWTMAPAEQAEAEDEVLEAFRDIHDLSRCFAGYFDLPPLWVMRSSDWFSVDTGTGLDRVRFYEGVAGLTEAGDLIAKRLNATRNDRWEDLLNAWRRRDEADRVQLLAWTTNLDTVVARELERDGLLSAPQSMEDAANDNDELRIAARMASALPQEEIEWILRRVREFPLRNSAELSQLARCVRDIVGDRIHHAWPFEQGEMLATAARDVLQLERGEEVDVFAVVHGLGVELSIEAVAARSLDALAVWGAAHGPAVLLNQSSDRHRNRPNPSRTGQARVTLAHELCHLLIDSEHTLSAVDVLHSHMPLEIEQRARAFAAEFLLPGVAAADVWLEYDRPRGGAALDQIIGRLCRRYTVTRSVAAWKLEHGARLHNEDLAAVLRVLVPQR